MKIKKIIIVLVVLSIAVGFVYLLHDLVNIYKLKKEGLEYFPYSLVANYDETNVIGPRLKEVLDGHLFVSEVDLYEYIGYPATWPILSPLLLSPILFLTKSVTQTVIISNFIFPAVAFLLLFLLAFFITHRKFLSIIFALVFSLFTNIGLLLPPLSLIDLKDLIKGFLPFCAGSHIIGNQIFVIRESFIPSFIPFCLSFLFTYLALKKRKWIYSVLAGIFFGTLFYTYAFHWIYFTAGLGIIFVIFLLQKQYPNVKKIIAIFAVAGLTSIFNLINYLKFWTLPQAQEIFERFGLEITHAFRWSHYKEYIIYILLAILIWIWGKRKNRKTTAIYVIGFLLAGIVVFNIQVITGVNLQPDHWTTRSIFFGLNLAWLLLLWWLFEFLDKKRKVFRIALVIVLILFSISFFTRDAHYQILWNKQHVSRKTISTNLIESFNWLEKNTPKDSVVMSLSLVTNYFIPLYTHNRIFIPRAVNTLAPEQEMMDRLYITYRFFNIPTDYLEKLFDNEINQKAFQTPLTYDGYEKKGLLYFFSARFLDSSLDGYFRKQKLEIPEEVYQRIINNYQNYPPKMSYLLKRYRLDYIYYGPQERKIIEKDLDELKYLEKVYEKEGVSIYKFHPQLLID